MLSFNDILILLFDGVVWCLQAVGGEQAGRFDDDGERGDDAAPDDSTDERQCHGLPEYHDRQALQASAGEMIFDDMMWYSECDMAGHGMARQRRENVALVVR